MCVSCVTADAVLYAVKNRRCWTNKNWSVKGPGQSNLRCQFWFQILPAEESLCVLDSAGTLLTPTCLTLTAPCSTAVTLFTTLPSAALLGTCYELRPSLMASQSTEILTWAFCAQ